ncbi:MAG: hypothetical protein OXE81_06930 [Gammaproteobacteria bacterium]|nr:hypothetical protein [Gammaproteobacteria bacterium]
MPDVPKPKQREEVLNAKLGELLIERHPLWNEGNVHIDSTSTIQGKSSLKIDVLVNSPGAQPVAIETKSDASGANKLLHKQIRERIGLRIGESGTAIEAGIVVKWPPGLTAAGIAESRFKYAIYQLVTATRIARWPKWQSGWLEGNVDDLADAVEIASLSEKRVAEGSETLRLGVYQATNVLRETFAPLEGLGDVLHQAPGEQTVRMAVAIIINAFVFHHAIEGRTGIPTVESGLGLLRTFNPRHVKHNWKKILEVNYWPIFSLAHDLAYQLVTRDASELMDRADAVATALKKLGATTFHDLAARMFQTLIADRKFLATFYTLPESAALLAELAVARMQVDWTDEASVKRLKVADFACGTGTLLSAVQSSVYRRIRRSGLDDEALHKHFMENVFVGTDIMPAAAHLATSMLSSAHPKVIYHDSLVHVMPYGTDEAVSKRIQADRNRIYIGALDLRTTELSATNLFTQSGADAEIEMSGQRMSGVGTRPVGDRRGFPVGHGTFDLVIMNPPFTRPTNHEGELEVPVPSFAGFATSRDEQREMANRLKAQKGRQFGHGNAGLASNFIDLAHDKLKEGGVLALVLPFAFVSGESWGSARKALARNYRDIQIVSIAASGETDRAFSADTGMAECLVLATKTDGGGTHSKTVQFANLKQRPQTRLEAHEFAKGHMRFTPYETDTAFYPAGVRDLGLIDSLMALCEGTLVLPRVRASYAVPLANMKDMATRGPVHRDINGSGGRGAFDIEAIRDSGVPTYPTLWAHDADRERQFIVHPDTEGIARDGCKQRAVETWHNYASRLHHNLDFRLNSQSIAVCITPEKSLGGTAWPNILPVHEAYEKPLLLWGNSTLGLMLFWWYGTRQQQGRARLTIGKLPDLPTIDCTALERTQLKQFEDTFEELRVRRFRPANEAYRDSPRKLLDERIFEILGIPMKHLEKFDMVRTKWCCEPSVHGGKSTMPRAAQKS